MQKIIKDKDLKEIHTYLSDIYYRNHVTYESIEELRGYILSAMNLIYFKDKGKSDAKDN